MGLVKLNFVGFVDESSKERRYIDTVLYEPIYIRTDKIVALCSHDDEEYPIPKINKNSINDCENIIEMIVDNFNEVNDFKQGSEITFEEDYTDCLFKALRYNTHNPYHKLKQFIVYENPKEIIRLINGEDVPLEVYDPDNDPRFISLESLDFTPRTYNILMAEGIDSVAKLMERSQIELLKHPKIGKKTLTEIKDALAHHGFQLKH
ncbi:DNA-directed RNA polymerase subunit alpha C-terminal domain-containing protein [Pasteurella multocida]